MLSYISLLYLFVMALKLINPKFFRVTLKDINCNITDNNESEQF